MGPRAELDRRLERVDELIRRLEAGADPSVRTVTQELVATLMELHAAGLDRVLTLLRASPDAGATLERLAADELVQSVLLLHGLHPVGIETRVREALEKTRPYLRSHGGNVELVAVEPDGTVRLRMQGSCHGCPSSAVTLKLAIEKAIQEAAPDVLAIVLEDEARVREPGPLPVVELGRVAVTLAPAAPGPP
jgi:Fe-S cluster biogenesis protein NfuA